MQTKSAMVQPEAYLQILAALHILSSVVCWTRRGYFDTVWLHLGIVAGDGHA